MPMIGILGAINIAGYEEMARRINWWTYHDCRMLSYTPSQSSWLIRHRHSAGYPGKTNSHAAIGRRPSWQTSPVGWGSSSATPSPMASPTVSFLAEGKTRTTSPTKWCLCLFLPAIDLLLSESPSLHHRDVRGLAVGFFHPHHASVWWSRRQGSSLDQR